MGWIYLFAGQCDGSTCLLGSELDLPVYYSSLVDVSIYFSSGMDLSVYCSSGVDLFYWRSGLDVDSSVSWSNVFHLFAGVVGWIFII